MIGELNDPGSTTAAADPLCRTGDPEMDSQHNRIFQALDRLGASLRGPFPFENLAARLRQLEDMTLDHFKAEEWLMEQGGYWLLQAHRAEHELIIERCHQLLDRYSAPDSPPLEQLAQSLATLFTEHIRKVDMDYAQHLGLGAPARCENA